MKSILKKDTKETGSRRSLKWDEENINENELEKLQNPRTKINEPKTPFIYYHSDTEDILESLNRFSSLSPNGDTPEVLESDHPRSSATQDDQIETSVLKPRKISIAVNSTSGSDWESSEDDISWSSHLAPEEIEKRKAFREMRKNHYRMKESIMRAKELLSNKENSDEEDDNCQTRYQEKIFNGKQ